MTRRPSGRGVRRGSDAGTMPGTVARTRWLLAEPDRLDVEAVEHALASSASADAEALASEFGVRLLVTAAVVNNAGKAWRPVRCLGGRLACAANGLAWPGCSCPCVRPRPAAAQPLWHSPPKPCSMWRRPRAHLRLARARRCVPRALRQGRRSRRHAAGLHGARQFARRSGAVRCGVGDCARPCRLLAFPAAARAGRRLSDKRVRRRTTEGAGGLGGGVQASSAACAAGNVSPAQCGGRGGRERAGVGVLRQG
jgi:hypothetical protein